MRSLLTVVTVGAFMFGVLVGPVTGASKEPPSRPIPGLKHAELLKAFKDAGFTILKPSVIQGVTSWGLKRDGRRDETANVVAIWSAGHVDVKANGVITVSIFLASIPSVSEDEARAEALKVLQLIPLDDVRAWIEKNLDKSATATVGGVRCEYRRDGNTRDLKLTAAPAE